MIKVPTIEVEKWPLVRAFSISRGSKTEAVVVVVGVGGCSGYV